MGIDLYLRWDDQTDAEKNAQITGFSTVAGSTGYLRESYHGGPYATALLAREAFDSETAEARIPAAVMRERLTNPTEPAYAIGGAAEFARRTLGAIARLAVEHDDVVDPVTSEVTETQYQSVEEAVRYRWRTLYDATDEDIERAVESFRAFVALAEEVEARTGEPATVHASY
jgi:hypothetical protein